MYISRCCKEQREANSELKTQMRFGKQDVEVLTKLRGSDEPYKIVSLNKFCQGKIPAFDDKIKWNKKKDKLPRRPPTGSPNKGKPPSMCLEGPSQHGFVRTSSQNDAPKKRSRKDTEEMETEAIVHI